MDTIALRSSWDCGTRWCRHGVGSVFFETGLRLIAGESIRLDNLERRGGSDGWCKCDSTVCGHHFSR
jgi:hypothetical protein